MDGNSVPLEGIVLIRVVVLGLSYGLGQWYGVHFAWTQVIADLFYNFLLLYHADIR